MLDILVLAKNAGKLNFIPSHDMVAGLSFKYPERCKQEQDDNYNDNNYPDKTQVHGLFKADIDGRSRVALNYLFLYRGCLVTVMGGRDVIDLVEFHFCYKLAVIIGLSGHDPIKGNRCIRDIFQVFILNIYREISILEGQAEGIILAFI